MNKNIFYILLLMVSLSGCQSDDNETTGPNNNNNTNEPVAVEFTEIAHRDFGSTEEFTVANMVVDSQEQWGLLLEEMIAHDQYALQQTDLEVDFSTHKVIVLIDELHFSGAGQYDIEVGSVVQHEGQIIVDVQYSVPGGNVVTAMATQPFHIVKIPQSDLPIVFE